RLSNGEWMEMTLKYKHRGEDKGDRIGGFGPMWECNWLAYLQQEAGRTKVFSNHLAGGGLAQFTANVFEYQSARRLSLLTGGGDDSGVAQVIEAPSKPVNIY